MTTTEPTIAVIGLGPMGGPIAQRLRACYPAVRGLDNSPEAQQTARAQGIHIAATVAECVADADIVFTALPTVQIIRAVMPDLLRHAARGATWVELAAPLRAPTRSSARRLDWPTSMRRSSTVASRRRRRARSRCWPPWSRCCAHSAPRRCTWGRRVPRRP